MSGRVTYQVADFETTVYDGQERTDVWAAAIVPLYTEDVQIYGSIEEFLEGVFATHGKQIIYFHNLKFDGSFILDFLYHSDFKPAIDNLDPTNLQSANMRKAKELSNKEFRYSISQMGQWYTISIKQGGRIVEFRDSLKLLPFSVREIGESFHTKHRKLDMEYKGFRYPNCPISPKEREYIANDVLVVKEGLEVMFDDGYDGLTIGACCMKDFKSGFSKDEYDELFPNLYDIPISEEYGALTAGEYIRNSYRGAWCYVVEEAAGKEVGNGLTADVNSLYPSVMHSSLGNKYPIAEPTFWKGDFIPPQADTPYTFYFVRIRTKFTIKPGKLPFIQIKNSPYYAGNQCLKTSAVYYNGEYYNNLIGDDDFDGTIEMTLTETDFRRIKDFYDLEDLVILDGCYFSARIGIFDRYINKWAKIKKENKGAIRTEAKLFLNNLYGKMASSPDSSYKVAILDESEDKLKFFTIEEAEKKPGYIPIGSAITSYARDFTIRHAQANYHGAGKPGFKYADTDSLHCDLTPEELIDIAVDPVEFGCWKLESYWDRALFLRQKTYIEHITHRDGEACEPVYSITCAGMPKRCKELVSHRLMLGEGGATSLQGYNPDELEFASMPMRITDFDYGLEVPGKLLPKRIPGGILLKETTFKIR